MLDLNHPHLIIDMAHIFCYGINKSVFWCDHFDHPNIRLEMMPINSIYIGWNNQELAQKQFIKILPSGYVITYIHCLENSGFLNEKIYDPIELINQIIKTIKINLMNGWRLIKGKVLPSEDGGFFDSIFNGFLILDQIFDKLLDNKTKDEILDFSTYTNYEEFNNKLYDSNIL